MGANLQRGVLACTIVAIAAAVLAGCVASGNSADEGPEQGPSETAVPDGSALAPLVLPATCTDLIGAELEAQLLADGIQLFSAPDGSAEYADGTITSNQTGGTPFSCWYMADSIETTVEIAVQPLTQDAHEGTLAVLQEGEFVEANNGQIVTFSQAGTFTEVGASTNLPAVVHVLHPDSWITISILKGGDSELAKIHEWLPIVIAQVYPEA